MEDRVLALCELSNDLLFHKISPNRLGYYVDGALDAGRRAATSKKGDAMEDRVLALCELSNDLLFHKISPNRLGYYVDGALDAGRRAARNFSGRSIQQIYQENGISIRYAGSGKQSYGVILRGQSVMSDAECSVEIYQESIDALASHSSWEGGALSAQAALEIHLAHEFYHIWEYRNHCSIAEELEPVTRYHIWEYRNHCSIAEELEPVTRFQILGIQRKAHIRRCEEVAAHAFAKEMLGLPVLPNFYDYLYLMGTGKMTQTAFRELTERMAALLSGESTEKA